MVQTKNKVKTVVFLLTAFALAAMLSYGMAHAQTATVSKTGNASWNFDDVTVGELPAVWKVDATNQRGPLATWQVIKDKTAPSGDHVLAMTSPNHTFGGTFNICWTDTVSFLDRVK